MKKIIVLGVITLIIAACGGAGNPNEPKKESSSTEKKDEPGTNPKYDPNRGEGKFTKVDVSATLDVAKADAGNKIYSVKCSSCHKLTDEKLVGPVGKVLPADIQPNGS